jgi:hypothetical protein
LRCPLSLWERVRVRVFFACVNNFQTLTPALSQGERELFGPLSLWERVRVRVFRPLQIVNPHPGPLPKGEGVVRSLAG